MVRRPRSIQRTVTLAIFIAAALPASVVVAFGVYQAGAQGDGAWGLVALSGLMLVVTMAAWLFARVVGTSVTADLRRLHAVSTIIARQSGSEPASALQQVPTRYIETESIVKTITSLVTRAESTRAQNEELAAYVAHDMRTPLAALSIGLRQIRSCDDADVEWLEQQRTEITRLLRDLEVLVEALRRRGEHGVGRSGAWTPVTSVASLVESAARRVVTGDHARVNVVVHRDYAIDVDQSILLRVVENLVANAVRYGAGQVAVEVGFGYLRVANEIGQVAASAGSRDEPASHGLGQMIVRRWVEVLGGKLVVQETAGRYNVDVFLPVAVTSRGGDYATGAR